MNRRTPHRLPHGWPDAVGQPGFEGWEATAAAWLLDLLPEYQRYPAIRDNPLVLAFIARNVLDGALEGTRRGYRTTRTQLGPLLAADVVSRALAEFRAEGSRLSDTLRAVELVENELRRK